MISTTAQAEMEEWYKKAIKVPNPNELPLRSVVSSSCKALSESELRSIVEGVLVFSRIKPLPFQEHEDDPKKYPIYLSTVMTCRDNDGSYLSITEVKFAKYMPRPSMLFHKDYDAYGQTNTVGLKGSVKVQVEKAITDYIKVNFDL
jgi:hypothetical protein